MVNYCVRVCVCTCAVALASCRVCYMCGYVFQRVFSPQVFYSFILCVSYFASLKPYLLAVIVVFL